jgi:hypothetical protein
MIATFPDRSNIVMPAAPCGALRLILPRAAPRRKRRRRAHSRIAAPRP